MENMMQEQSPYLAHLNPVQREAVEATEGPLLVLAGAGTGKTRVLISRLAHILNQSKAWPSEILAVTFTNKAAFEMRERLEQVLGNSVKGLWLGTFHSIGARILRRHAPLVGLNENFTIIDPDDQLRILKQILELEGMDAKKQSSKYFAHFINLWKDRGLTPEKVSQQNLNGPQEDEAARIYGLYQERLKVVNAVDFGDLLLQVLVLFQGNAEVLAQYQNQFRYILVDEYQDTNVAQYLLLRLLAQKGHDAPQNICVVGDDDQSIYGWRGAEVGNILRFEKDFPGAKTVRLEQNYRSTPHILGAASTLIAHNKTRLGKTLWTDRTEGEHVRVKGLWDAREEARFIGEEMENLHRKTGSYTQMAVLVRAGFQTREFEEAFMTMAIPYKIIGGVRFYERQEIRDALAYLRLVVQPHDDLALTRILNVPRRGVGKATLQKLHESARAQQKSLFITISNMLQADAFKGKTRLALLDFIQNIRRWQDLLPSISHEELTKMILDESGYTDMWQRDKSVEAPGRLENLKELVAAIAEFQDLPSFLEHVSLVMDNATSTTDDTVTLMTMHSAKGLEYDTVFLAGWEEGVFPSQKTLSEGSAAEVEEERRLGYVGLTRARKQAYITFAANRSLYGKWQSSIPSRFIRELDPTHVVFLESSFLKGGAPSLMGTREESPISRAAPPLEIEQLSNYYKHQRVFHDKFGYGSITQVMGNQLTIRFDHTGEKKIMDNFVKPA